MVESFAGTRKIAIRLVLVLFVLVALGISGFSIAMIEDGQIDQSLPQQQELVDVIVNGDFELPWEEEDDGVAPHWEGYANGQAWQAWYEETWPEAVHTGEQAQLMEIFEVEANVQGRVIAIHQTVDVAPNSTYDLEFYALMRTQAPPHDRNNDDFEMHWGVDYSGEGDYDNVEEWIWIPLEEQFRLGSTGEYPDDVPLFYEQVTGTIETGDSESLTLFIRGLKKWSIPPEVNFDVDDVSLVGPSPDAVPVTPEPDETEGEEMMPATGRILPDNVSAGAVILGGLVVVVLGVGAAASVLLNRKET